MYTRKHFVHFATATATAPLSPMNHQAVKQKKTTTNKRYVFSNENWRRGCARVAGHCRWYASAHQFNQDDMARSIAVLDSGILALIHKVVAQPELAPKCGKQGKTSKSDEPKRGITRKFINVKVLRFTPNPLADGFILFRRRAEGTLGCLRDEGVAKGKQATM